MNITLIRAETEDERAARDQAALPVATYLVIEGYPRSGCATIRECELPGMTFGEVVSCMIGGQWDYPQKVLLINEKSGFCMNVSCDIAKQVIASAQRKQKNLIPSVAAFCISHGVDVPAWMEGDGR